MMLTFIEGVVVTASASTIALLLHGVYLAYFHPLAKIPGPKLYALTDWFYLYHLLRGTWVARLKQLHDDYGTTVRYAPNEVSTITPAWKQINGHKKSPVDAYAKDPMFYDSAKQPVTEILTANQEDHRRMRRVLAHAFSEKALRGQLYIIDNYVNLFISQLTVRAERKEPVNIAEWYNFATFDLIGDLAFGKPFDCLKHGVYSPIISAIFQSVKMASMGQVLHRHPWCKSLTQFLIPMKASEGFAKTIENSRETVLKRIERGSVERQDFMDYILRHNDEKGLSTDEIAANAFILFIAGSETTATQLSGTTWYLMTNRDKYQILVKEIRDRFKTEEEITAQAVNDMPYLLAVLSESLRMYPPVPGGLSRLVKASGDDIDGYYLPEKTQISIPHVPAYRSTENWTDPDKFVPERFLGTDPRYVDDKRDILEPFSVGPRNCIGKNLAYLEMRLILARTLWRFDLALRPESWGWRDQKIYGVWEKGPLMIDLIPVER